MKRSAVVMVAAALGLTAPAFAPLPAGAQAVRQQSFGPDLVCDVQRSLNQRGYAAGPVDGVMGPGTRSALSRFQRDNTLPGAGMIDQQTLAALGITGLTARAEPGPAALPPGQTMAPRMALNVQSELQRLGYYTGPVNGVWGPGTERALREFQRDRHLAASGRIDEQTLAALEAGGATQTGQLPAEPATPGR